MLFNSIPFLFFFTIVYFTYWNIKFSLRPFLLILAGCVFYAYFSLPFLINFLLVISFNYFLYRKIISTKNKSILSITIILNVLNLGFFKYFYFFTKVFYDLTNSDFFLLASEGRWIKITLPLAISFYTFQIIAFAVDSYKNQSQNSPLPFYKYLLFVLFFPVLVAGPIMRAEDFFPNLERKEPETNHIYKACFLMMSGLIKKILIADPMASFVSPVYANPSEYNNYSLLLAAIFYTIQLYGDFSGLTDMARSVSYFLGFEIPENFHAPFFSSSVREFWKRWHVTLSSWLQDYIYFPLGGSRLGEFRTYINLILTMTIGGFWHGADYTFIAWGFYLGIILSIEKLFYKYTGEEETKNRLVILFKILFTHLLISISVMFFRSNSTELMFDFFKGLAYNYPEQIRNLLTSKGDIWLLNSLELVQSEKSFMMNQIKNIDSAFNMYLALLVFHLFQFKPELLNRFEKYKFSLVIILGVITIFLLTTLSQDGEGFVYTTF